MARGSIEKRTARNGMVSYRARIPIGSDLATGKRLSASQTFRTRKAAESWLRHIGNQIDEGTYAKPSNEPLGPYLQHWLDTRTDLADSSRTRYECTIRLHLTPALGTVALGKITGRDIQALYNAHTGTSIPASIRQVLVQVFDQAIAEGLMQRNPARGLRPPSTHQSTQGPRAWDAEQLATFLRATEGTRFCVLFHVLAASGLRIGEALALTWRDVDIGRQIITVRSETKNRSSQRQVTIDGDTMRRLAEYRIEQRRRLHMLDLLVTPGTIVFDAGAGVVPLSTTVKYHMRKIAASVGLPPLNPHGIRHSHSAILLAAGRPLNYVQRRLGHASATTTLRYYAHVLPGTESEEATAYERIMREAQAGHG